MKKDVDEEVRNQYPALSLPERQREIPSSKISRLFYFFPAGTP